MTWIIDQHAIAISVAVLGHKSHVIPRCGGVVLHPGFKSDRRTGNVQGNVARNFLREELIEGGGGIKVGPFGCDPVGASIDVRDPYLVDVP